MDKFLQKITNLKIRPKKKIISGGKGSYKGGGLGDSLDFYGHRKYIPGDDLRKIDWQAFLKTEDFYIREYSEERELNINIFLDTSKSMDYGENEKWFFAKRIALGLSFLSLKDHNNLTFYAFNKEAECFYPKTKGKESLYFIQEKLKMLETNGQTDFSKILELKNIERGISFFISDLWDDRFFETIDFFNQEQHEVYLVHILSEKELEPEKSSVFEFFDVESLTSKRVNVNEGIKRAYRKKMNERIESISKQAIARDIIYRMFSSKADPSNSLVSLLEGGL